ncbi:hypothetical protein ACW2Q0_09610 [Nocardia sp. R16R-3T]
MSSTVRISIALFVGYTAYLATAFLLGERPDEVGDRVRLLSKGLLIVLVVICFVEWLAKRNAGAIRARVNSQMSSESQAPQPTASGPPTAG